MRFRIFHTAVIGLSIAAALPSVANAQESPPSATVTTQETTSQATGPSMTMVWSGAAIFALSYIPAVVVGTESELNADRTLFVPIVGPWIDLTQRPGCGPNTSCNTETAVRVLLVTDGAFQAIGAITLLVGFLTTAHKTTTTTRSANLHPTVHFLPAQIGPGGYGMVALGTF